MIVLSAGGCSAQLWVRSEASKCLGEGVADAVLRVLGSVEADRDGGVWELDRCGAGGW